MSVPHPFPQYRGTRTAEACRQEARRRETKGEDAEKVAPSTHANRIPEKHSQHGSDAAPQDARRHMRERDGRRIPTFLAENHYVRPRKPVCFVNHDVVIDARRPVGVQMFLNDAPAGGRRARPARSRYAPPNTHGRAPTHARVNEQQGRLLLSASPASRILPPLGLLRIPVFNCHAPAPTPSSHGLDPHALPRHPRGDGHACTATGPGGKRIHRDRGPGPQLQIR